MNLRIVLPMLFAATSAFVLAEDLVMSQVLLSLSAIESDQLIGHHHHVLHHRYLKQSQIADLPD
ncbi:hypothetical protein GALL_349780 [mine drainage metagenome]|uniref:Uncharacterized protein n=1 Tax=mine drainage metagenome TaxID=410659 RepID=A0A1J5QTK2_9ZZZZ